MFKTQELKDQAVELFRDLEPGKLGQYAYWKFPIADGTQPCCALGHMMQRAGFRPGVESSTELHMSVGLDALDQLRITWASDRGRRLAPGDDVPVDWFTSISNPTPQERLDAVRWVIDSIAVRGQG